jgi:predicted amidohydrolase YtcJ
MVEIQEAQKMKKAFVILLLATIVLPSVVFGQAKKPVTILLYNGKVFTADEKYSIAEAVAIDGERIVAVGKSADLRRKYRAAQEIDLGGKLVTPGFNDAHVHFLRGAIALLNVNLVGVKSLEAAKSAIAAKAKELKPGEWIIGRGWDHTLWDGKFPTRNDLDAVAPINPVFLVRVDGHVGWANTKALELAGVTNDTIAPDGGEIERDASGIATGILKETAQGLVNRLIPAPSVEQQTKGLDLALKMALEYGITSVQDNSGYATTKLYREFLKKGKLTVRVSEWQNFEDSIEELRRQREEFAAFKDDPNRLKLGALKGYVDGTLGSKTASMLAPFSDDPANSGLPRKSPEELTKMIIERAKEGWQIALHAIGDRANRMALDGFAEIQKQPQVSVHTPVKRSADGSVSWGTNFYPKKTQYARHRIEHAQVVAPSDFKRFAELGIIASMQPSHAITDQRWADSRLGEYRVLGAYSWHLMRSYGIHMPFGTDFPVESIDPYRTLFAAVARQEENGKPAGGWQPQERLSMAEAIRCHTYESAYAEFVENQKGTIEAGKLADLVVHSKDLLVIAPPEILTTRPVYVIFNGKLSQNRER